MPSQCRMVCWRRHSSRSVRNSALTSNLNSRTCTANWTKLYPLLLPCAISNLVIQWTLSFYLSLSLSNYWIIFFHSLPIFSPPYPQKLIFELLLSSSGRPRLPQSLLQQSSTSNFRSFSSPPTFVLQFSKFDSRKWLNEVKIGNERRDGKNSSRPSHCLCMWLYFVAVYFFFCYFFRAEGELALWVIVLFVRLV